MKNLIKIDSMLFMILFGSALFWGPFLLFILIAGKSYSGEHVIFLTFFVPITMAILTIRYKAFLLQRNLPFRGIYCFVIGFIGPLIPCLFFFFPMMLPLLKDKGVVEVIKASMYMPLGIISALTYSGMLGAMFINMILFSIISLFYD